MGVRAAGAVGRVGGATEQSLEEGQRRHVAVRGQHAQSPSKYPGKGGPARAQSSTAPSELGQRDQGRRTWWETVTEHRVTQEFEHCKDRLPSDWSHWRAKGRGRDGGIPWKGRWQLCGKGATGTGQEQRPDASSSLSSATVTQIRVAFLMQSRDEREQHDLRLCPSARVRAVPPDMEAARGGTSSLLTC